MHRATWTSLLALAMLLLATGTATACGPQVRLTFVEESPDFFRIEFLHGPKLELKTLRIDLTGSIGKAHVDTAYGGAPSPPGSNIELERADDLVEGGQRATLTFARFFQGQTFNYLVDLDDMSAVDGADFDHLTGDEMAGGTASARLIGAGGRSETIAGVFDKDGIALLGPKACV